MVFLSAGPSSAKMTPSAAWSWCQPAMSVSLIDERMAGTARLRGFLASLFWGGVARSSTISTKSLRDRSARLRSRRSARRNIGSGRSPCASVDDPFREEPENKAFTSGRPIVVVIRWGKIDAMPRNYPELLECFKLQGIGAGGPARGVRTRVGGRSEEHTSELQSRENLVCR